MSENQRISPSLSEKSCLQQVAVHRQLGFTLMELMVVISILGIMLGVAIPSLQTWLQHGAVNNATTSLFLQLKQARSFAVAESRDVKVSFSSDPYAFTYDDYSHAGDADCSYCKNIVTKLNQFSPRLTISGVQDFTFSSSGTVMGGNDTAILQVGDYSKCIYVNIIGRARVGVCP